MSIVLHANLQVVLKLMKKRLQQLQPTEEVDAGVPIDTSDGVPEQPCDPTEALSQTELPTKLWALQYGISTYFEVTDACGNVHAITTCISKFIIKPLLPCFHQHLFIALSSSPSWYCSIPYSITNISSQQKIALTLLPLSQLQLNDPTSLPH